MFQIVGPDMNLSFFGNSNLGQLLLVHGSPAFDGCSTKSQTAVSGTPRCAAACSRCAGEDKAPDRGGPRECEVFPIGSHPWNLLRGFWLDGREDPGPRSLPGLFGGSFF